MRSGNREPCPATSEQCLLLLYDLVVVGFGAQNGTVGLGVVRTAYARARAAHSEITRAREFTTAVLFALHSHCKPNVVSDTTSSQRVVLSSLYQRTAFGYTDTVPRSLAERNH